VKGGRSYHLIRFGLKSRIAAAAVERGVVGFGIGEVSVSKYVKAIWDTRSAILTCFSLKTGMRANRDQVRTAER
jgi:hypothetical protein